MRWTPQIIFLVSCGLFLTNQAVEISGFCVPIISSYLDDLLCFPIVLTMVLLVHRYILKRGEDYVLPISHIIVAVLFFSFVFEWLAPLLMVNISGDPIDTVAYAIGAALFNKCVNKPCVFQKAALTTG